MLFRGSLVRSVPFNFTGNYVHFELALACFTRDDIAKYGDSGYVVTVEYHLAAAVM